MTEHLGWSDALWLARRRTPNDTLRFWVTVGSAGIAAALLCLAISLVTQFGDDVSSAFRVVADGGTRGGAAFAVLLVALPAIHLTGQAWRLGSVEQRDRLRQLRDAGAGPADLRRVAVTDTVIPTAIGSVVGLVALGGVIGVINARRGGATVGPGDQFIGSFSPRGEWSHEWDLIPNPLTSTPWAGPLALALVSVAAVRTAGRAARHADRAPRPQPERFSVIASRAAGRSSSPALVLALRRLAADPRTTARPAALLFLASFVAFSGSWFEADTRVTVGSDESFVEGYAQAFALVRAATVVGLALCLLGLLIALGDAILRRRRVDAAALASGVPLGVLRRAVILEVGVVALPAIVLGGILGVVFAVFFVAIVQGVWVQHVLQVPLPWSAWLAWGVAIPTVTLVAALTASRLLRRTTEIDQLRIPA